MKEFNKEHMQLKIDAKSVLFTNANLLILVSLAIYWIEEWQLKIRKLKTWA